MATIMTNVGTSLWFVLLSISICGGVEAAYSAVVHAWDGPLAVSYPSTDHRLTGAVYQRGEGSTVLVTQCAWACLRAPRCASYNFNANQRLCELNNATHDDGMAGVELVAGAGFSYFHREAFTLQGAESVLSRSCQNGGRGLVRLDQDNRLASTCHCDQTWTGEHCQTPVEKPGWSVWSEWGPCSTTCGQGWQLRHRSCRDDVTVRHASECFGRDREMRDCLLANCTELNTWSEWEECSTNRYCGFGESTRRRSCSNTFASTICLEDEVVTKLCISPACDVPVRLEGGEAFGEGVVLIYNDLNSTWMHVCSESWSTESGDVTCRQLGFAGAYNVYTVSDTMEEGDFGLSGVQCVANETSLAACQHAGWLQPSTCKQHAAARCIVDGEWGAWGTWGSCDVQCGAGTSTRRRLCDYPAASHGGAKCTDHAEETRVCVTGISCHIIPRYSEWSGWSACNVTCGGGIQIQNRTCLLDATEQEYCTDPMDQAQLCNQQSCPVDGFWDGWAIWGECNTTCGGGRQSRIRACVEPKYGGTGCSGVADDMRSCNNNHCPIDGFWEEWGEWNACNVTCGGGTQNRQRACVEPKYGGASCDRKGVDWRNCNEFDCPVDGFWQLWSTWSECNATCDGGAQYRDRACVVPKYGGASCMGSDVELRECGVVGCPAEGVWTEWGTWGRCSTTCGGGMRMRWRMCENPPDTPTFAVPICDGTNVTSTTCHEFDCTPIESTCSKWHERGLVDSGPAQIDPLGWGVPFWVRCDMDLQGGVGVTEIVHDHMKRQHISGYEAAGEYPVIVKYNATLDEAIALVDISQSCRQYISWECQSSSIKNDNQPDGAMTLWLNRYEEKRYYWGGAEPGSLSCACGMDDSCDVTGTKCNCDANDGILRQDDGYLNAKDDLPVHTFLAGDTGGEDEWGFITIGPLQCY